MVVAVHMDLGVLVVVVVDNSTADMDLMDRAAESS